MGERSATRSDLLSLDSTQTVRALSPTELGDRGQRKWFVVQLVTSGQPINLDMMPRLEVFASHRLYVVEARRGATSLYELRLGFFDDEVTVNAICAYLGTFFGSPSVVRVSAEEQARFAQSSTHSERPPQPVAVPEARTQRPVPRETTPPGSLAARPTSTTAHKPTTASNACSPKVAGSSQLRGSRPKTLGQQLLEEAREVQRSRNSKKQIEPPRSWLSRLLGGTKA